MNIKYFSLSILSSLICWSLLGSAELHRLTKLPLYFTNPRTYETVQFPINSEADETRLKLFFEDLFAKAPAQIIIRSNQHLSLLLANQFIARQNQVAGELLAFKLSRSRYGDPLIEISPVVSSTKDLTAGKTQIIYKNGIIDEITPAKNELLGETIRRQFPDGSLEVGQGLGGPHFRGYRIRKERISFHPNPVDVLTDYNSDNLFFLKSPINKQIVLVEPNSDGEGNSYQLSNRDAVDWLVRSLSPGGPSGQIASHLSLALKSILTTDDKIARFYQAIFSGSVDYLSLDNFTALIEFAQEKDIALPWSSSQQQSIFIRILKQSAADAHRPKMRLISEARSPAVGYMLEKNPGLANVRDESGKSPLLIALDGGALGDARSVIAALDRVAINLADDDKLYKGAVLGDIPLTDDEVVALPDATKKMVYRIANMYDQRELVGRLNRLGLRGKGVVVPHDGMSLLHPTMDAITAHEAVVSFLKRLRAQRRLLTADEFVRQGYRKKGDIGRLIGADLVARTARQLGLDSIIKVPEKIAVIRRGRDEIAFHVLNNYKQTPPLGVDTDDLTVYAKDIHRSSRKISLDEMRAILLVSKQAGYADIWPANFIVAHDGIYFIDTEYKSLDMWLDPGKFARLKSMLDEKDRPAFLEMVQKEVDEALASPKGRSYRRGTYYPSSLEFSTAKERKLKLMMPYMQYYGLDTRLTPFRFKVSDLTSE